MNRVRGALLVGLTALLLGTATADAAPNYSSLVTAYVLNAIRTDVHKEDPGWGLGFHNESCTQIGSSWKYSCHWRMSLVNVEPNSSAQTGGQLVDDEYSVKLIATLRKPSGLQGQAPNAVTWPKPTIKQLSHTVS